MHDSGVAYCSVAKSYSSKTSSTLLTSVTSNEGFSDVNIDQETVYYMQDVPINNTDILARTFFDEGSNRVLIRDEYAAKAGLVKKKVFWKLLVVGRKNQNPLRAICIWQSLLRRHESFGRYGAMALMLS